MHSYSTDESKVSVYGLLAIGAVVSAWLVVAALARFSWPEWLVSAPSMAGTFTLLYKGFDLWWWDSKLVRITHLSHVQNLTGVYVGSLTSSWTNPDTGQPTERQVEVEVSQTWSHMLIRMKVVGEKSTSSSRSINAAVYSEGDSSRLVYTYSNKHQPLVADDDMSDHDGTADIVIRPDGKASGRYFNARPRKGSMHLSRTT